MSIFSSPQNRGSAVLTSVILVAAAAIAGLILGVVAPGHTAVNSHAEVAATLPSEPLNTQIAPQSDPQSGPQRHEPCKVGTATREYSGKNGAPTTIACWKYYDTSNGQKKELPPMTLADYKAKKAELGDKLVAERTGDACGGHLPENSCENLFNDKRYVCSADAPSSECDIKSPASAGQAALSPQSDINTCATSPTGCSPDVCSSGQTLGQDSSGTWGCYQLNDQGGLTNNVKGGDLSQDYAGAPNGTVLDMCTAATADQCGSNTCMSNVCVPQGTPGATVAGSAPPGNGGAAPAGAAAGQQSGGQQSGGQQQGGQQSGGQQSGGGQGGLPQMPQQQQQSQPQTTSNCSVSSLVGTLTSQSISCATTKAAYTQQQSDYQNQLYQYNNCKMQAAYAQQSGQCLQQCQPPQAPPAPCYQQQQCSSSGYGCGTDGQPCSMQPAQPDASQCANGSFQPVSSTQNGCITSWQCVPSLCGPISQRPDPSLCNVGTWNPVYAGNTNATVVGTGNPSGCIVGWQCVPGNNSSSVQASLTCSPTTADVGTPVTFNFICNNATASTGYGFNTNGHMNGTTTAILATPPAGSNAATYTLACSDSNGASAGASCTVQVAIPKIVLVANPANVTSGNSTTIGWITTGMKSCTASSPQDAAFTTLNANNTSINGVASTSPITQKTDYILTCTTLGGNTKIATTTVSLVTASNSFLKMVMHFLHLA